MHWQKGPGVGGVTAPHCQPAPAHLATLGDGPVRAMGVTTSLGLSWRTTSECRPAESMFLNAIGGSVLNVSAEMSWRPGLLLLLACWLLLTVLEGNVGGRAKKSLAVRGA